MANEKNTLNNLREKAENSKDKYRKAREIRADFIKKTVLKLDKNDKFLSLSNEEIIQKLASLISYIPENAISENVEIEKMENEENIETRNDGFITSDENYEAEYRNSAMAFVSNRHTDLSND